MKYQYQRTGHYFAQVANGLEDLAADELSTLGVTEIDKRFRGLYFKADPAQLYGINYSSRILTRVLAPLLTFDCHSAKYLYKTAMDIPWEELFTPEQTFAIFAQVSNSNISHSKYASLKLKDAIVDRFRDKVQVRPNVDPKHPDIWLNLHIEQNRAVISLDTSGSSLHRRGYRQDSVPAPMQETLAAAIIKFSDWKGENQFIDPMCGSGTLPAEAYMAHTGMPAGHFRKSFGFERLPDFDRKLWKKVKSGLDAAFVIPNDVPIQASDIDSQAMQVARRNLDFLPGGKTIKTRKADFRKAENITDATLVMNPPYGIRLLRGQDLSDFYKEMGDWLKQSCTGSTAYVYFGDRKYLKNIGLRPEWKKPLMNGGLDGRLAKFVMY
ncbi:MAG: class I SAM-dependent RNA methyltransferase [Candidatus Marinimicrobia bacterium]|nr:class I SAM-dependent RNA methyltransferase [Candidatus Neomarinimicrobiota bacterium]MCF7851519.1 class I SAM-dependent RNA methyltransferase [Candidatus Neomarinimicrobiota bacterium]